MPSETNTLLPLPQAMLAELAAECRELGTSLQLLGSGLMTAALSADEAARTRAADVAALQLTRHTRSDLDEIISKFVRRQAVAALIDATLAARAGNRARCRDRIGEAQGHFLREGYEVSSGRLDRVLDGEEDADAVLFDLLEGLGGEDALAAAGLED